LQRLRYWRSRPRDEQFATLRRTLARRIKSRDVVAGGGWERTFWPGEDFKAPRLRAPVLLFKRPRQPYYYLPDPEMGWGARSSGGVEIVEIDCEHYEMMREPYVRVVSEELKNRLQALTQRDVAPRSELADGSELVNRNSIDPPGASGSFGSWAGWAS
jgi:hypothetical protein